MKSISALAWEFGALVGTPSALLRTPHCAGGYVPSFCTKGLGASGTWPALAKPQRICRPGHGWAEGVTLAGASPGWSGARGSVAPSTRAASHNGRLLLEAGSAGLR